ncbi:hypothetical protein ACP70R_018587 [Stipagrostis hirtigluma subsp. patula]
MYSKVEEFDAPFEEISAPNLDSALNRRSSCVPALSTEYEHTRCRPFEIYSKCNCTLLCQNQYTLGWTNIILEP